MRSSSHALIVAGHRLPWPLLVGSVLLVAIGGAAVVQHQQPAILTSHAPSPTPTVSPSVTPSPTLTPTPTIARTPTPAALTPTPSSVAVKVKYFSPADFVQLYYSLALPNTAKQATPPAIYGAAEADVHLQALAEGLGYKLQPLSTGGRVSIQGQQLEAAASTGWLNLQAAARAQGITLGLVSGYRSVESQRSLFINSLHAEAVNRIGRDYTMTEIAAGTADEAAKAVLKTRSIPGYSKHHTGYVMDVSDVTSGKDFTSFRNTKGYLWISANNFQAAKEQGFIPSYPEGAASMGPNPEAWEFIYVGLEHLTP